MSRSNSARAPEMWKISFGNPPKLVLEGDSDLGFEETLLLLWGVVLRSSNCIRKSVRLPAVRH
jgi:hypothetical protein